MSLVLEKAADKADLSRVEAVYYALREDILGLKIGPSDQLYESVLSESFDASRTPVREALQRLQAEGLLNRQGRACRVPEVTLDFVNSLYSVREALECKAVQLFARNGGSLVGLRPSLEEMDVASKENDYHRFNAADIDFHRQIAQGANNDLLVQMLANIWDRVLYVRGAAFRQPERVMESLAEHCRIVDALERGNAIIAEEEMRAHLASVPSNLKRQLRYK